MAAKNCILFPNSCETGTICYNFGVEPSCVRKDSIIPLDSYEFIAYQTLDSTNNTITIDISKYKYYRYQSLTLEPVLKYIYIVLSYNNNSTKDYSVINKSDIPVSTNSSFKMSYSNTTPRNISSLPSELIKQITTTNLTTPIDQLISFTLGPETTQSAIPSKLIINLGNSNLADKWTNIGIKSIQLEDINGVKSKNIVVKNITDITIDNSVEELKLKQITNSALSSLKKTANMLKDLKQNLTYVLNI
jgi:hypothetical protein